MRAWSYYPAAVHRFFGLAILSLLVCACTAGQSALLSDVSAGAPAPSPALQQPDNHLRVQYTLNAPGQVTAYVEAEDGRRWQVHDAVHRPVGGEYQLSLDGTIPGPGPEERRALPDGQYRVVVIAQSGAASSRAVVDMAVRDADTIAPEVENLALFPDRISPNFDAQDDVTRVTYRLSKASQAVPFADRMMTDGSRRRAWTGEERSLDAGEQLLTWDGLQSSVPLPDGSYEFGIRVEDAAGNVTVARRPLTIASGGRPDAKIVQARISPREIVRGTEICADIQVRNTGQTVLRTEGPDPGYVYNSFDTFASIEDHAFVERAGFWRVALDWAPINSSVGAKYAYRWGFGRDLQPGEDVTVHGCVRVFNEQTRMVFFAGLIQENVAIHDSGIGLTEVTVSP